MLLADNSCSTNNELVLNQEWLNKLTLFVAGSVKLDSYVYCAYMIFGKSEKFIHRDNE